MCSAFVGSAIRFSELKIHGDTNAMPKVNFGTKKDKSFELVESDDLIAVRSRSKKPMLARGPVPRAIEGSLSDCELVHSFPEAGVEIYRVPKKETKELNNRKATLRRDPDVRFAGGVLTDKKSNAAVLYTENMFIKFVDSLELPQCEKIIRDAGLAVKEKLGYATNAFFVQATEGSGQAIFDQALALLEMDVVENCHPELIRPREGKLFFPNQWHLASTTIAGILINNHASVDFAHSITRGEGTTIAIIDDGVDLTHPEFSDPGKIVAPFDAVTGTNDPSPGFGDNHGTSCAGVACATGLDGAAGVAPAAKLMPIRLAANLGSIAEAKAFQWAADKGADIISCSWGPPDGKWFKPTDPQHNANWPLPASTKLAIDYATTKGRQGRGCVVVFAAGNGNESVDLDGYASYQNVIAVAACNDRGTRSVYSDFGKAVSCCFPSSDFEFQPQSHPAPLTNGIWTTDLVGSKGYNSGIGWRFGWELHQLFWRHIQCLPRCSGCGRIDSFGKSESDST
jgi:subtilisin family serine protease